MKTIGIIPSRYDSTRFPGKPLAIINGKSMVQRVYEQTLKCPRLSTVVVATDNDTIAGHVQGFGGNAVMTSEGHATGTERCHEALLLSEQQGIYHDVAINIQGDEPFIDPGQIDQVIGLFSDEKINIGTLIKRISENGQLNDPNIVKVVVGISKKALYFSRAAIPFVRDKDKQQNPEALSFYKHIGIYGYRSETLKALIKLPPGNLEAAESLEQLRWLEHGFEIYTAETAAESTGIDTYEDLLKINRQQDKQR
jgi:3-deoxy-manno-octulosonate cytidylyltransferase (CMP-KDO synthetase)